ncbi:MAG: T9SS type A sorting domain-containing protein, partial [Bacteroidota bacterium]
LIAGPYTISWPGIRGLPSDWVLILLDNETGEKINMRERNNFKFNLVNADNDPEYKENHPGSDDYQLTNQNYDKARFTLVVSTKEIEETIPWDLFLTQNFPNPFRERTNIRFGLSEGADVQLDVFDVMGRKVETLIDSYLEPGFYEEEWSPAGISEGIYVVSLKTGQEKETFKMTLIR